MKPKLNRKLTARIRSRRAEGATFQELATEFHLALGTIHKSLRTLNPAKAPPAQPAPPGPSSSEAPPTREELLSFLGAQARGLRADVEAATESGPRAAANRNLVAVQALIARLMPEAEQKEGVLVSRDEIEKGGANVRTRWRALIAGVASRMGPPCPHCKRPMPPSDAEVTALVREAASK